LRLPTVSDLIADLQLAKDIAVRNENPNGIVLAVMSQAKLLALDKPIIDVTSSNDPDLIADYSLLTDDELRQLMAITEKAQQGSKSAKPIIIALTAPETDDNGKVIQ
jgi:hypothetical protein